MSSQNPTDLQFRRGLPPHHPTTDRWDLAAVPAGKLCWVGIHMLQVQVFGLKSVHSLKKQSLQTIHKCRGTKQLCTCVNQTVLSGVTETCCLLEEPVLCHSSCECWGKAQQEKYLPALKGGNPHSKNSSMQMFRTRESVSLHSRGGLSSTYSCTSHCQASHAFYSWGQGSQSSGIQSGQAT